MIFGTYKFLRIFSPSLRNVPLTGLEWSFLVWSQGYNEYGYKQEYPPPEPQKSPYDEIEMTNLADHQISEDQLNEPNVGGLSKYFDEEYN